MILYHGSPIQGLKIIKSNNIHRLNMNDKKKYIHLTEDIGFAACYGIRWNDSTFNQGYINDKLYFAGNISVDKLPDTLFSIYEVEIPHNLIKVGTKRYITDNETLSVLKEHKYKSFRDAIKNNIFDITYVSKDVYLKMI